MDSKSNLSLQETDVFLKDQSFLGSESEEEDERAEMSPDGRYIRFSEKLGGGASKTVYRGFDHVQGIAVAWCQVHIHNLLKSEKTDLKSEKNLRRLYAEAELVKTLNHKNIIKCFSSWVDNQNEVINMITELVSSGSLRQFREKHKYVDAKDIKDWARQILRGLEYLHGHNPPIIHRDLKCGNVFVTGNGGEVKIGDFGCATARPHPNSFIGTLEFVAPELYDDDYNELADIYSFGMCLLELVTCEYPYSECKNQAQIFKKVNSGIKPLAFDRVKDMEVKQFIEKCLVQVSLRLPASELLKDPFLLPENSEDCVKNVINMAPQLATLEFRRFNEKGEFRLRGEKNDEKSISFNLRVAELHGHVRNIEFIFYLGADTALSVANEMIEELDFTKEDVDVVVELMNNLITKLAPDQKTSCSCSTKSGDSVAATVITEEVNISSQISSVVSSPKKLSLSSPFAADMDQYLMDQYLHEIISRTKEVAVI